MLRPNANDASFRFVELHNGDEVSGLTTEIPSQLCLSPAPKSYALPTDWGQHKETIHRLYLVKDKPLREVMYTMDHEYEHYGRYVS